MRQNNSIRNHLDRISILLGKKVSQAFELFQAEPQDIPGALAILNEIKTSDSFDGAMVDYYLAQMNVQIDKPDLAIKHIKKAVDSNALNFKDHAIAMRLLGDLYLRK